MLKNKLAKKKGLTYKELYKNIENVLKKMYQNSFIFKTKKRTFTLKVNSESVAKYTHVNFHIN